MPNTVYKSGIVRLIDGSELYISPLKIKYLREFMDAFKKVQSSEDNDESLNELINCVRIAMKQFMPKLKTTNQIEDCMDIHAIYDVLKYCAGISLNDSSEEDVSQQAKKNSPSWEDLDIVAIESEVFLLGIWKDYDDLEESLSMDELIITLNAKRDSDYENKKFLAAIQGIDLDKQSGKGNEWEEMKARVFSGGKASDSNDILAYQGINAQKAGFGIGMGLAYEKI